MVTQKKKSPALIGSIYFSCMYASRGLSQLNFREGTKQWEKASTLKDLLASFTIDNIRNGEVM